MLQLKDIRKRCVTDGLTGPLLGAGQYECR